MRKCHLCHQYVEDDLGEHVSAYHLTELRIGSREPITSEVAVPLYFPAAVVNPVPGLRMGYRMLRRDAEFLNTLASWGGTGSIRGFNCLRGDTYLVVI